MNKKIKFLSALVCGAALSSTLALTSVQAAEVKGDAVKPASIVGAQSATATYSNYNYYATISETNLQKVINYYNTSNPTETQLINFLVTNNITSSSVANTISSEFHYFLGINTIDAQDYGNGITFLKVDTGSPLIRVTVIPNDLSNYSYTLYTKIPADGAYQASSYIADNPGVTVSQLTSYLISNNIVSSTYASKVASLLLQAGPGQIAAAGRINLLNYDYNPGAGILVLQSKTNSNAFVLAPQEL